MKHALKVWPEYYQDIESGKKPFELRKNDRDFKQGDILLLQEWDPKTGKYTRNEIELLVSYILEGGQFGLEEGYVIMALVEILC
jgi:ASC-1-like (ASCH) protein